MLPSYFHHECGGPDVSYEQLVLVWSPGRESSIHDHVDSHCIMKVPDCPISSPFCIWRRSNLDLIRLCDPVSLVFSIESTTSRANSYLRS